MGASPGVWRSRLALRWLIGGEWRWHPARFLLTAAAIAVGVALGFAVHLINGSALASFESAVRGVNGAADLTVRAASPLGVDEALYPRVATAAGVADASPVVRLDATIGRDRLTLLGLDVIRAAGVTPGLVGARPQGQDQRSDAVFDEDALFLSRAALGTRRVGQRVAVAANGRTLTLTIRGVLPGLGDEARVAVIDIAAAQWRYGRLGRLDRIDLRLSDRAVATDALAALLPGDAILSTADAQAAQGDALSRAYRVNLDMLALVALLTGGFLVFSAQSLSVARRMRAFALVRTLGLPRGGIATAVALEGLAIGVIGSGLGLAAGYALAWAALHYLGADLGAGYFGGGGTSRVVFQPWAAAGFFVLGLAAAALGSALPARAASRAAPAAALKNAGDLLDPRARVPWLPAAVLLGFGSLATLLPAVNGLPVFGFVGMALLLAGGVSGVPWLARQLLRPFAARPLTRVPMLLAVRHIHGAPAAAATALCGIVASTALMIAMATMVTSFRGAVDGWLGQVLGSDLYLRTVGGAGLDPATQSVLRTTPGIRKLDFGRTLPLTLAPDQPAVTLIARPVTPDDPLVRPRETAPIPPDVVPVWVSEPAQRLYGWDPGETVALPVVGRVHVAGVWRDYARQAGAVVIRLSDYRNLTGDRFADEASAMLAPDAKPNAVGRAMLTRLPAPLRAQVEIAEPAALRRYALQLFDRSFAVTYLLEAVAILVGLAGVAATMSAQTVARAREFGMLRHIGIARAQITQMLACEGTVLGLVGGVAGVGLGLVLGQVLVHVINPQSFNWTMDTLVPWATLAGVVAALAGAAAGTAVLAGRRATAHDALLAVREDW